MLLERGGRAVTWNLHEGDALAWLRRLPTSSVDVMITDPPYSEHTHSKSMRSATRNAKGEGKKGDGKPVARELGFASLSPRVVSVLASEAKRLTKRWSLVFADDESVPVWRAALTEAGLEVVRTMIWIKPNGAPQLTGDRPGTGWEAIVLAHQTRSRDRPTRKRWNGGGRHGVFVHCIEQRFRPNGDPRVHTTEKPIGLMLDLVRLFSDPGEMILDPFAGAGSTGAACIRLGRSFLGAEMDRKVAREACRRLEAETEGTTILARERGQVPLFGATG
jgi:DNA modification methylase